MRSLPNFLTFMRVLVVPIFVVLMLEPTPIKNIWAAGIFIGASVTDWLDGYLARLYKVESKLGSLLDPLADKILVTAALVMLASTPCGSRIPGWVVVVILSREFFVSGLRSIAAVNGIVVKASRWAKHKTAWLMVAIPGLLIDEPYVILGCLIDFHKSGIIYLTIALFFTVFTGIAYAIELRKVIV